MTRSEAKDGQHLRVVREKTKLYEEKSGLPFQAQGLSERRGPTGSQKVCPRKSRDESGRGRRTKTRGEHVIGGSESELRVRRLVAKKKAA